MISSYARIFDYLYDGLVYEYMFPTFSTILRSRYTAAAYTRKRSYPIMTR